MQHVYIFNFERYFIKMPIGGAPQGYQQRSVNQTSCFDRVKMGFGMGFCVGMVIDAVFAT